MSDYIIKFYIKYVQDFGNCSFEEEIPVSDKDLEEAIFNGKKRLYSKYKDKSSVVITFVDARKL